MPSFKPTRRGLWITSLIAPGLLVMILFVAYPIISALAYAFYDWNGLARGEFVGFKNFSDVLLREPYKSDIQNAFMNNVIVFFSLMVIQNGAAFLLAYALWREFPLARFHRIAVFLPVVLSTVIVGYLWKLFLNPVFGLVNNLLKSIGLTSLAQPWLGQPETALPALILVNAWHWVGFPTLIFLAAMQRIPGEIYDAARMETESEWVKIRKIIWPLVAPAATIVFVLQFIGSFNWFELPYVMEDILGSPYGHSDVLALYFYRLAFGGPSTGVADFGHGSAVAVLVFVFITAFAATMTVFLRRREIEL
ncbi:carbohydrate ABC transporter permease [Martelella endophytica]|uniref:Sugar ABC transporter permease n=1 Tax=Martelella endophytica TaxID=1486262 RepID=A0A0D5LNH9_MAREN|nr:sugar ABC transporter permease [Martelella endophytica]AJY45485.1 sugar ABC transporter permease [Martelella endophytica]